VRHPEGKGAGKTSDFYASIHDIAPTILAQMDIEPWQPMDGQDLTPILEGKGPERQREHFTLGYNDYVLSRDERYALVCRNDGSEARLYDLDKDPNMDHDISGQNPGVVRRMWEGYILKDAGGPLPKY
jgi:arylsulfatase A-like enzyme